MEQYGAEFLTRTLSCSICLDILKEPVTTSCGHSYCRTCISDHWDTEDNDIYTCPECRVTFSRRPDLGKSIKLAELVEELKKNRLQDVPDDQRFAAADPSTMPTSRARFLEYSQKITLDPNTAQKEVRLSGNRKVTFMKEYQLHPDHPDRFTGWHQVLSRESLNERCYWEVEWRGEKVGVSVAYKSISRAGVGRERLFGANDKSWMLDCSPNSYTYYHNEIESLLPGPGSFRIGVYVDHRAGVLSFYSISETMTLLRRVQTNFTEPLYAGLCLGCNGDSAELCKLK